MQIGLKKLNNKKDEDNENKPPKDEISCTLILSMPCTKYIVLQSALLF